MGDRPALGNGAGFLTLPFVGPHLVTAIFDHCAPGYIRDGRVCRFDGSVWAPPAVRPLDGREWRGRLFYDGHDGIDYGLYYESVAAAADGVVTFAGWDVPENPRGRFGLTVLVDHRNGYTTRYAHLQSIRARIGQAVRRGEVLGLSGNSGASTGEHLHWGVYLSAGMVPVDPYGWTGDGSDPWAADRGNLWLGGAPRFADIQLPRVTVAAAPAAENRDAIDVSWSSPGGGSFDIRVVDGEEDHSWLQAVTAGASRFQGRPGHSYWFLATVQSELGWTDLSGSAGIRVEGTKTDVQVDR